MRLLLDLQVTQRDAASTEIGQNALLFAKALAGLGHHEVWVLLNGLFHASTAAIRAEFAGLVDPDRIRTFHAPGPVAESLSGSRVRMRVAELLREEFIAGLQPDLVHVGSVSGGFLDDAVFSIGRLQTSAITAVTVDDLTPILGADADANNSAEYRHTLRRLEMLKRADLLLVRSDADRDTVLQRLNAASDQVVVISNHASHVLRPNPSEAGAPPPGVRDMLRQRFILSVVQEPGTGTDLLLSAYALLPRAQREAVSLVLVCLADQTVQARLREQAVDHGIAPDEVKVLGPATDVELADLFRNCVVYVSLWGQGPSMPLLQNAASCGAPILTVDDNTGRGLLVHADLRVGPNDPQNLAGSLLNLISSMETRQSNQRMVLGQRSRLGWASAAHGAMQAFEALHARRAIRAPHPVKVVGRRMRLAFLGTIPPVPHGNELLSQLLRDYDVEYITATSARVSDWIQAILPLRDPEWFENNSDSYGRIVYAFAGTSSELPLIRLLQRVPGTVLLQNYRLGGIFAPTRADDRSSHSLLLRELYQTHGLAGPMLLQTGGYAAVTRQFACNGFVFRSACGVIVPSPSCVDRTQAQLGQAAADSMVVVPPVRARHELGRASARSRLDIPPDALLVCCYGRSAEREQGETVLQAWRASTLNGRADATLVFVWSGPNSDRPALQTAIASGHGASRVLLLEDVAGRLEQDCLAAADIAIQLVDGLDQRSHSAVLDALLAGLPVITDADPTALALPDKVLHVLPGPASADAVLAALEQIDGDLAVRQSAADAARTLIEGSLHPATVGAALRAAVHALGMTSTLARQRLVIDAIADFEDPLVSREGDYSRLAVALTQNAARIGLPQILCDVTVLVKPDADPNHRRIARAVLKALVQTSPPGYRIEAVRLDGSQYRYARSVAAAALGVPLDRMPDADVDYAAGDVFLDLSGTLARLEAARTWLSDLRDAGGRVVLGVSDEGLHQAIHTTGDMAAEGGLVALALVDQVVCTSQAVADELRRLANERSLLLGQITVGAYSTNAGVNTHRSLMGLDVGAPDRIAALLRAIFSPSQSFKETTEPP